MKGDLNYQIKHHYTVVSVFDFDVSRSWSKTSLAGAV
jgi:hypothetical protein